MKIRSHQYLAFGHSLRSRLRLRLIIDILPLCTTWHVLQVIMTGNQEPKSVDITQAAIDAGPEVRRAQTRSRSNALRSSMGAWCHN